MPKLRPALIALLLLTGCNKSDDSERAPPSQVLEGTISDNMLPLEKLTSEAPLAEPTGAAQPGGKRPAGSRTDAAADTKAPDAPAPAETAETSEAAPPAAEQ